MYCTLMYYIGVQLHAYVTICYVFESMYRWELHVLRKGSAVAVICLLLTIVWVSVGDQLMKWSVKDLSTGDL